MKKLLIALSTALLLTSCTSKPGAAPWQISESDGAVSISGKNHVLNYVTKIPAGSKLTASSACYIHPLKTPAGITLTNVAPADHPHHRGIFLAWYHMEGDIRGDFWGWGKFAPTKDRVIEHRQVSRQDSENGSAEILNHWMAADQLLLKEQLHIQVRETAVANIVDLSFTLTPTKDLSLPPAAYSGFVARLFKTKGVFTSPWGRSTHKRPHYLKPERNWADAAWYDASFEKNGQKVGLTVISHRENPATRWHNLDNFIMINPTVTSLKTLKLPAGRPFTLKYRLIAHDGPVDRAFNNGLAAEFNK